MVQQVKGKLDEGRGQALTPKEVVKKEKSESEESGSSEDSEESDSEETSTSTGQTSSESTSTPIETDDSQASGRSGSSQSSSASDSKDAGTGAALEKHKGKGGVTLHNPAVPNTTRFVTTRELIAKQQKRLEERKAAGGGGGKVAIASGSSSRRKFRRRQRPLTICLSHCRYDLVRATSQLYGLIEVTEDTAWNIYWTDYSVSLERAVEMRRFQIVNHFPGMNEICRKDLLARNLNRMKRVFPEEYNIYPMTWCLPADNNELQAYSQSRRGKTYICKPEMGCQGRGIFLVKNLKDLNPFGRIICQVYVQKPFLIDHLKFDLRMYVLITSCDPLRVYIYKEGLARFATAKYRQPTQNNTENSYMHLTNYAVNKFSRDFVVDEEAGTKRKLTTVFNWLEQRGYDLETLEKNIHDVILKTILSAQPILKHHYRTCFPHHDICSACFEILGFDILIDQKLKPYVIEVNHSPSFHTDTKLDHEIKEALLQDTFAMLHLKQLDRFRIEKEDRKRVQERLSSKITEANRNMMEGKGTNNNNKKGKGEVTKPPPPQPKPDYNEKCFKYEMEHRGGYKLIYPIEDSAKYDRFLTQNTASLYQGTAASEARANLTRVQMDEYNMKKQLEEQKRFGGGVNNKEKDGTKLRPESANSNNNEHAKTKKKKILFPNSLLPMGGDASSGKGWRHLHIVSEDECERVKGLMQRGMLIRSLGIELQVKLKRKKKTVVVRDVSYITSSFFSVGPLWTPFTSHVYNLLTVVGNLKKSEHEDFRRKHGFTLPANRSNPSTISRLDGFTYPSQSNSENASRQEVMTQGQQVVVNSPHNSMTDLGSPRLLKGAGGCNLNPGGHRKDYLRAKLVHHQSTEQTTFPASSMFAMRWAADRNHQRMPSVREETQRVNDPLTPPLRVWTAGGGSRGGGGRRPELPTGAAQVKAITKCGPDIGGGAVLNRNSMEIQRRYDVVHDRKLINALSALRSDLRPVSAEVKGEEGALTFDTKGTGEVNKEGKASVKAWKEKPPKSPQDTASARRWMAAASLQLDSSIKTRNRGSWSGPLTNDQLVIDNTQGPVYPIAKNRPNQGGKASPLGRLIPNYQNQVLGASGPNLESAAVIFPRRGNNKLMNILNPGGMKRVQGGGEGEVGFLRRPGNWRAGQDLGVNINGAQIPFFPKDAGAGGRKDGDKERNTYDETALFLKGFHLSPKSVGLGPPLKL